MDANLSSVVSPFCGELRSKKYYFQTRPALVAADVLDASNDCWCARTQMRIGPDDEHVGPDVCTSGRACFRGAGAGKPEA